MAKHGKTKVYSKQHFVPQSYTKAWCDPESEGQPLVAPYVWVFDQQGQNPRAKSPSKLFTETDIYTVPMPNGERDLVLEHGFQQLEDSFARLRRLRLSKRKNLSHDEALILHIFVATAKARTAAYRDFQRKQWRDLREKVELFHEDIRNATEAEKEAMRRASKISIGRGASGDTITIQDIKQMEDFPIQELITPTLRVVLPIYARMSMAVLCTDDETGFITSDSPVTWFDPEAYKLPPLMRSPGLARQGIEVTFPISPNQCLALTHNPEFNGYINISKQALTELNRRHVAHCSENFISRSKATNVEWFRKGEMPPDAWENRHRPN